MDVLETTCGSLLLELQRIWDEVGEGEVERDKMLVEIEKECLEVYRRKVDDADKFRSELRREISVAELEIQRICSALGDKQPVNEVSLNLKEGLRTIKPLLEEMRRRRMERKGLFVEVVEKLQKISNEIYGSKDDNGYKVFVEETDLSMEKLEELRNLLYELQNEKRNRLNKVLDCMDGLNSLCDVLGMDFKHIIHKIHPTLDDSNGAKDITDNTIKRLATAIQTFREVKIQRMQKLKDLAAALLELWNLLDIPMEEQLMFQNVTSNIAATEPEITEPNILSMDFINHVEKELSRLEQLKSSKLKEIVQRRKLELEEICRNIHMVPEYVKKYSTAAVMSETLDPELMLEEIELEIATVKEEAFCRKEILDKVEKWLAACEEESWLEEYNRNENRYNAGRGTHLALKRAEKARAVVNKVPAMVEALTLKTAAWEEERGIQFLYDGERLLSRLEEYSNLRQQKEQERLKQRDQKKLQVQLIAEQEAFFGAKPSPLKSGKKTTRNSTVVASDRKLSFGGAMLQNFKVEKATPRVHPNKKGVSMNQNSSSSNQQFGGFTSQFSGRRNPEIPGHSAKKQSSAAAKPCETVSGSMRKPLSPLPLTMSSNANIVNFMEDQNRLPTGTLQSQDNCTKIQMSTPTKSISVGDEENRTPKKLPFPVPTTPSTISAPMLMALTPSTPYVSSAIKTVKKIMEQTEYSFEELRAGFICPTAQS